MTDTTPRRPDQDARDLDLRGIVGFAIGLTALIVLAGALMWFASSFLRGLEEAKDPPRPVLPEARETPERPGPLLQEYPLEEMQALRQQEHEALTSYAWVDEGAGVASVPIERAMELMLNESPVEGQAAALEATDE